MVIRAFVWVWVLCFLITASGFAAIRDHFEEDAAVWIEKKGIDVSQAETVGKALRDIKANLSRSLFQQFFDLKRITLEEVEPLDSIENIKRFEIEFLKALQQLPFQTLKELVAFYDELDRTTRGTLRYILKVSRRRGDYLSVWANIDEFETQLVSAQECIWEFKTRFETRFHQPLTIEKLRNLNENYPVKFFRFLRVCTTDAFDLMFFPEDFVKQPPSRGLQMTENTNSSLIGVQSKKWNYTDRPGKQEDYRSLASSAIHGLVFQWEHKAWNLLRSMEYLAELRYAAHLKLSDSPNAARTPFGILSKSDHLTFTAAVGNYSSKAEGILKRCGDLALNRNLNLLRGEISKKEIDSKFEHHCKLNLNWQGIPLTETGCEITTAESNFDWNSADPLTFTTPKKTFWGPSYDGHCFWKTAEFKKGLDLLIRHGEPLFTRLLKEKYASYSGLFEDLGRLHWVLSHASIYRRGSAAVSENLIRALMLRHGIDFLPFREEVMPDVEALMEPDIEIYSRAYRKLYQ